MLLPVYVHCNRNNNLHVLMAYMLVFVVDNVQGVHHVALASNTKGYELLNIIHVVPGDAPSSLSLSHGAPFLHQSIHAISILACIL